MSRYQNLMTEILDSIFEGYTVDGKGKLKVVNEDAAKVASEKLHTLVLEKSRDLWDQLEAAEDSLSGVAEEISFEELNADPSSMSTTVTHDPAPKSAAPQEEGGEQMESAQNISELLGSDDFDLSDVFENMDHLDSVHNQRGDGRMPFDEMGGDMSYEDEGSDVEDGDEEYDDLMIGMDDNGMGSPDSSDGLDDGDYEDGMDDMNGDSDMDMGDESDLDMGDENGGDDMGFDFELDLEGDVDDLDGVDDEDEMEGMGHGDKSYRMESEGDDDDDDDDDKDDDKDDDDDDDDDDDKPAFLKKKDD